MSLLGKEMRWCVRRSTGVSGALQENYLNHRSNLGGSRPETLIKIVAGAAEAFSQGDLVNRSVRQYQNWHLMPFAAAVGSVLPAALMRGPRETFFPGEMNFPRWARLSLGSVAAAMDVRSDHPCP